MWSRFGSCMPLVGLNFKSYIETQLTSLQHAVLGHFYMEYIVNKNGGLTPAMRVCLHSVIRCKIVKWRHIYLKFGMLIGNNNASLMMVFYYLVWAVLCNIMQYYAILAVSACIFKVSQK